MANYLTIDGGTTNTRLNLITSDRIVDRVKLSIGARNGAENNSEYKKSIKNGIDELISRNKLEKEGIEAIICSGMITSEGGLFELAHIQAPAGIEELSASLFKTAIPEISDVPFVFIPGVKLLGDELYTDMMRGEETELYGLCDTPLSNTLYVLPGSHSKLIRTDEKGRIQSFLTTLTGEMVAALSEGTILKGSLDLDNSRLNEDYLIKGCKHALKNGLNAALFKVRILDKALGRSNDEVYSFFLGAILSSDYNNIIDLPESTVAIGGKAVLRDAISLLLEGSGKKIVTLDDVTVETATAIGAMMIYKKHLEAAGNGKAL